MDIFEALILKAKGDMSREEYWDYVREHKFGNLL